MSYRILTPILFSCAVFAGAASAESDSGFYVQGFIGGGFPGDADFSGTQQPDAGSPGTAGAPADVGVEFDGDTTFGVAVGYDLPVEFFGLFHPRLELEYSTLDADVDTGSFNGGNQTFGGDVSIDFYMVNNYTDIIWDDDQTIIPFIGGGLGIANVESNIIYGPTTSPTATFGVFGDESGLAGTIAGGVSWRTNAQWDVYAEARYYQIRDIEFERRFIGNGSSVFNAEVDDDLDGTTLTAGLRYRF